MLKSGRLSSGPWVKKLEQKFAEYCGVNEAIATSSGTTALDVVLKALGIGKGDEVIVPSFTFIATANSVLFQGAKPVFADVESETFCIDPEDVAERITKKTRAIIGVHLFGHPFDVDALSELCEDHSLVLIEDAAQAHGAEWDGKKVGSFGIGCFSLYATKNMTSGEGGIITTNDSELASRIRMLINHGRSDHHTHTILGYNYRMSDVHASIGVAQLERLDEMNEIRRRSADLLRNIHIEEVRHPVERDRAKHVYHQYVVLCESHEVREELKRYMLSHGVECGVYYPSPVQSQPLYRNKGYTVDTPVSQDISKRVLSIPVHPSLKREEI